MSSYTSSDQRWIVQLSQDNCLIVAHNRPIRSDNMVLWAKLDADTIATTRSERRFYARLESTIARALDVMHLVGFGARVEARIARAWGLLERSRRQRLRAQLVFLAAATPTHSVHHLPEELRRHVCELARQ
jgi:hypothetical protein